MDNHPFFLEFQKNLLAPLSHFISISALGDFGSMTTLKSLSVIGLSTMDLNDRTESN
jgi:hypothetical protein